VDQSHRTVLRLAKRHADLDITLSDGEDRGRTLTEPPICTLVVTGRLVCDETQIGALCAAALSRRPAGQVGPVAEVWRLRSYETEMVQPRVSPAGRCRLAAGAVSMPGRPR
jgi:hypothetical protein